MSLHWYLAGSNHEANINNSTKIKVEFNNSRTKVKLWFNKSRAIK